VIDICNWTLKAHPLKARIRRAERPMGPLDPTDDIGIRIDRFLFGVDHKYDWQTIEFIGSM
jgi:hypothetical protein